MSTRNSERRHETQAGHGDPDTGGGRDARDRLREVALTEVSNQHQIVAG